MKLYFKQKKFYCTLLVFLIFCSVLSGQKAVTVSTAIIKSPFPINSLCWSKDDSLFAYSENNAGIVRNSQVYSVVNSIPMRNIRQVFLSNEGSVPYLQAVYNDNVYSVWDVNTGIPELTESYGTGKINSFAFSKNGDYVAVSGDDGKITLVFKLRYIKSTISRSLAAHKAPVYDLAFSDNSQYLASVSEDGQLCIWSSDKSNLISSISKVYTQNKVPVSFSFDSQKVFCCDSDKSFAIYSIDGKKLKTIKVGEKIKKIKNLYDRNVVAVLTADNKIRLYNMDTGNYFGYIPAYNASELSDFAFSFTNYYVLVGFTDGSIYKLKINDVVLTPDELPPEFKKIAPEEVVVKGQLHNPEIFKYGKLELETPSKEEPVIKPEPESKKNEDAEDVSVQQEPEPELQPEEENPVEEESVEEQLPEPSEEKKEEEIPPKYDQPEQKEPEQIRISDLPIDTLELMMEVLQNKKKKEKDTRNAFYIYLDGDYLQKPFLFGIGAGLDLRILELTAPFYFGFGIETGVGFPNFQDFQYTYRIKGSDDIFPFIAGANIYLPCGFILPLWSPKVQLVVHLRTGVRIMSVSIVTFGNYMIGNPNVSFFFSGEVGVMIKSFEVNVGCKYDGIGKFSPAINLGFNLKMGKKEQE